MITALIIFAYFVLAPGIYIYFFYVLHRELWKIVKRSQLRFLAIGILTIVALWLPILSPLRAYLTYKDLAAKHAGPNIIKTVDNVERIYIGNIYYLIVPLATKNAYRSIEFHKDTDTPYVKNSDTTITQYAEATHDTHNNKNVYRDIEKTQSKFTIMRTRNELDGQVSIHTITIRSTTGETLGIHNTIVLCPGGVIAYFHPKEFPSYYTPAQHTQSEINFIESVLRPRKTATPLAAQ